MRLKSKLTSCLVLGVLILSAVPAMADGLTLNGDLWTKYFFDISNGGASGSSYINNNGFDLYRADLKGTYKFNDTYSAVMMFDSASHGLQAATAPNLPYVREAYGQANWWTGGHMTFGLQPSFYSTTVDGATHTRWLAQDAAFTGGFLNEENAGIAFTGSCWNNMIGYNLTIQNGAEGFSAPFDNGLAFDIGVDIMPFTGSDSPISKLGLIVVDQYLQNATSQVPLVGGGVTNGATTPGNNVVAASLHWSNPWVDGAFEFLNMSYSGGGSSSSAYGGNVNVKLMDESWSIFARYLTGNDQFKGNNGGTHPFLTNLGLDSPLSPSTGAGILGYGSILTVGPTYTMVKDHVSTALLYTMASANASGGDATTSVSWNWGFGF